MAIKHRKPLAAINITPLVDVLLILLSVLILAMPMFAKRFPVSMPATSSAGIPTAVSAISVSVSESGTLYLGESVATLDQVLSKVTSKSSVEIAASSSAKYEHVAKLLAAINEKSPKEISLVTK